jgi:hypothetical protein
MEPMLMSDKIKTRYDFSMNNLNTASKPLNV